MALTPQHQRQQELVTRRGPIRGLKKFEEVNAAWGPPRSASSWPPELELVNDLHKLHHLLTVFLTQVQSIQ
jgi:hypothetical protein